MYIYSSFEISPEYFSNQISIKFQMNITRHSTTFYRIRWRIRYKRSTDPICQYKSTVITSWLVNFTKRHKLPAGNYLYCICKMFPFMMHLHHALHLMHAGHHHVHHFLNFRYPDDDAAAYGAACCSGFVRMTTQLGLFLRHLESLPWWWHVCALHTYPCCCPAYSFCPVVSHYRSPSWPWSSSFYLFHTGKHEQQAKAWSGHLLG